MVESWQQKQSATAGSKESGEEEEEAIEEEDEDEEHLCTNENGELSALVSSTFDLLLLPFRTAETAGARRPRAAPKPRPTVDGGEAGESGGEGRRHAYADQHSLGT